MICCETASKSYKEICATVGGPNEKVRAEQFEKRITVLPDVPIPAELAVLNISGQIKPRSLLVFSFGIAHKALTVTANKSFIRSAKMQVSFFFFPRQKKRRKLSFSGHPHSCISPFGSSPFRAKGNKIASNNSLEVIRRGVQCDTKIGKY